MRTTQIKSYCLGMPWLFTTLLIAGCGGGGGGSGTQTATDSVPKSNLELAIRFPTVATDMNSQTDFIVVSGSLTDTADNEVSATDVASLTVNDIAATLDPNDPSLWTVRVPINGGTTNLRARVVSASGSTQEIEQLLLNQQPFVAPNSITLNPTGSTAYVLDEGASAIFSVDMATGGRGVVSAWGAGSRGTGDFGSNNSSITFDGGQNRVVYASRGIRNATFDVLVPGRFRAADLDSGDRTAFGNSSSPVISNATIVDPASGILYGVHRNSGIGEEKLISINPASGQSTLNSKLDFDKDYLELSVDAPNNRLIALSIHARRPDEVEPDLTAVDLTTGVESAGIDSCFGSPDNVRFRDPTGLDVDAANGIAYVTDLAAKSVTGMGGPGGVTRLPSLVAVDLASGDCSLASGYTTGTGVELDTPEDLALDLANNRALVVDSAIPGIIGIDLVTGDRTLLSNSIPTLSAADLLALDLDNDRIFVANAGFPLERVIYEVDLQTRLIRIVTSDTKGAGDVLADNADFVVDVARNRLLSLGSFGVYAIDIDTGDRTLITGDRPDLAPPVPLVGAGPQWNNKKGIEYDALSDTIYVLSDFPGQLFAVDPVSGDRRIVSDPTTGTGPVDLTDPKDLAIDAENGFAYVISGSPATIVEVDLTTGDRRITSDNTSVGVGQLFINRGDLQDIAFDKSNQRLLVNSFQYVDIATGNRERFFKDGLVNGDIKKANFRRSALDPERGLVYLSSVDTGDGILIYDRETHAQGLIAQ